VRDGLRRADAAGPDIPSGRGLPRL
jgi:hypothetical protein